MLETRLVQDQGGFEQRVVQPCSNNFFALWAECCWEGVGEDLRMVEVAADKEVGIRRIHPRVKHFFLPFEAAKGVGKVVIGAEVITRLTVQHSTSLRRFVLPRLDICASRRHDDLCFVITVPNWNLGVIPPTATDRPINADVVHPVEQELAIAYRVETDGINVLSHAVLDVGLPNIPFFEQDDFNWILATL